MPPPQPLQPPRQYPSPLLPPGCAGCCAHLSSCCRCWPPPVLQRGCWSRRRLGWRQLPLPPPHLPLLRRLPEQGWAVAARALAPGKAPRRLQDKRRQGEQASQQNSRTRPRDPSDPSPLHRRSLQPETAPRPTTHTHTQRATHTHLVAAGQILTGCPHAPAPRVAAGGPACRGCQACLRKPGRTTVWGAASKLNAEPSCCKLSILTDHSRDEFTASTHRPGATAAPQACGGTTAAGRRCCRRHRLRRGCWPRRGCRRRSHPRQQSCVGTC